MIQRRPLFITIGCCWALDDLSFSLPSVSLATMITLDGEPFWIPEVDKIPDWIDSPFIDGEIRMFDTLDMSYLWEVHVNTFPINSISEDLSKDSLMRIKGLLGLLNQSGSGSGNQSPKKPLRKIRPRSDRKITVAHY